MKPIIVTGGAGFIGSHLVERLLADGKSVVVIDDLSTGSLANLEAVKTHPQLRMVESRVSDCDELAALVSQAESIYHLAAAVGVELVLNSPLQSIQTNLHETEAIFEAASQHRVPVLLTSSSEVYGKGQKKSFSEDDDLLIGPPTHSRWSYACSKLMDEFLALAYARERGLPVIIARLFNTVGPRQTGRHGMVLPRFIAAAKSGETLRVYGDGAQRRCFCHVLDIVEAVVQLQSCQAAQGEIFNVCGNQETSIMELARLVVSIANSRSAINAVPYSEVHASGFEDMSRHTASTEKLRRYIQFTPHRTLEELIRTELEQTSRR